MGGRPPAPRVEYIPAPPPPVTVSTPTQSLRTQTELMKVTGEQTRLNMETGSQLDRLNEEFYTGQDLRRYRARGAEERLLSETRGEQERATIGTTGAETRATRRTEGAETRATRQTEGQQTRLTRETEGAQTRRTRETEGAQTRLTRQTEGSETRQTQAQLLSGQERQIGLRGREQRAAIGKSGEEARRTALQQEAFRRYKENRDFQQSRDAYKS